MAISLRQFMQNVVESGLLSSDEVWEVRDELQSREPPIDDAQTFARELVRRKKLTPYQASALYMGKTQGLVLGNYVILDKIGQGGMGIVYKAEHRRMKRTVAIKVLPLSALRFANAVKRFHREVEAVAKLSHPNIVAAHDADESQGVHFLVMEFVDGIDLGKLVRSQGALSVSRGVQYLLQVARGLEHAHLQGVVHRDIKPSNLLLNEQGQVKILDMGLARFQDTLSQDSEHADLTASGRIMGTADYMAPEQALDTKTADQRADIYSLGCTLFYLLTAKMPYGGDTLLKKVLAHREDPLPSLCEHRSDVPAELDALFQKLIAKRPEDRCASMTEVIQELLPFAGDESLAGGGSWPAAGRDGTPSATAWSPQSVDRSSPGKSVGPEDEGGVTRTQVPRAARPAATAERGAVTGGEPRAAAASGAGPRPAGEASPARHTGATKSSPGPATSPSATWPQAPRMPLDSFPEIPVRIDQVSPEPAPQSQPPAAPHPELPHVAPQNEIATGSQLLLGGQPAEEAASPARPPAPSPGAPLLHPLRRRLGPAVIAVAVLGVTAVMAWRMWEGRQADNPSPRNHSRLLSTIPQPRPEDTTGTTIHSSHRPASSTSTGGTDSGGGSNSSSATGTHSGHKPDSSPTPQDSSNSQGTSRSTGTTSSNANSNSRPGPVDQPAQGDVDESAIARELLKRQGRVWLAQEGERPKEVRLPAEVPPPPLHITSIHLLQQRQPLDETLLKLRGLPMVSTLWLTGSTVSDDSLAHLGTLPRLAQLNLSKTNVTDRGLTHLRNVSTLSGLWLDGTPITDAGLEHLASLTALSQLQLGGTQLDGRGLRHLSPLAGLTTLSLEQTQVSDESLSVLRFLTRLTSLNLDHTPVTDAGLAHLAGLQQLASLSLASTAVSSAGVKQVQRCTRISSLNLSHTKVDDGLGESLPYFPQLAVLQLQGTAVTDALVPQLKSLTKLRSLQLQGTKLTSSGVAELKSALPQCRVDSP